MGTMWYVARTEPRAEFVAAAELERDDYNVLLPCIDNSNSLTGPTKIPLFPGYIFLSCNPDSDGWPTFRGAHRIAGWVKFGGEVPCLPDSDVSALMERLEIINQQGGMLNTFSPGDQVEVDTGILQCLAEVVEGVKTAQARAKVLLNFMGRQVFAQVPWENLRHIEGQPEEKRPNTRRTRGRGRWINKTDSRSLTGV